MEPQPKTIIVYGPMMCGKTRNRRALAAHFGVNLIIDDWQPKHHSLIPGALHLTHEDIRLPGCETHAFKTIKFDPDGDNGAHLGTHEFKARRSRKARP